MASVNVCKYNMANMKGLRVHLDSLMRQKCNHSNEHINTTISSENRVIGCKNYSAMMRKLKNRIDEVDKEHPPKKLVAERVVCLGVEVKCPKELSDFGKTDDWFASVYNLLRDQYGELNVIGGFIHKDEVHEYYDADLKAMTESLEHCHFYIVPETSWTDKEAVRGSDGKKLRDDNGKLIYQDCQRHGINAKHFVTKDMLRNINQLVDELCVKEYGISYMTHGLVRGKSVEQLKVRSESEAEILRLSEERDSLLSQINELSDLLGKNAVRHDMFGRVKHSGEFITVHQDTYEKFMNLQQGISHMLSVLQDTPSRAREEYRHALQSRKEADLLLDKATKELADSKNYIYDLAAEISLEQDEVIQSTVEFIKQYGLQEQYREFVTCLIADRTEYREWVDEEDIGLE